MIADDLLHFYRYGLSLRGLILKDMRRHMFLLYFLIGLYLIKIFCFDKIHTGNFILDTTLQSLIRLFLVIVPLTWSIYLVLKTRRVIRGRFVLKAKKDRFFYRKRERNFIELLILKTYLERKNVATKEAVDELIETLEKREEIRKRNSFPLYASSFALLFIPLWSATNNSIFKSMTTLKEICIYFIVIGVFIILFNIVIAYFKYMNGIFVFSNKLDIEELIHKLTDLSYEYYILENNLKEDNMHNSIDSKLTIKFKVIKNVLDDYYKKYPKRI